MNAEHRPTLHVRPRSGWVNDPNGIGVWDGRWHVMFQHNPHGTEHGDIHWGHMSSVDLLSWRDEGTALRPRPGTLDAGGVWSGVALQAEDGTVLVYTATSDGPAEAGTAVARRGPGGTWIQGDRFVAPPPGDPTLTDVRDPSFVTVAGRRYAVQGGGTTDGVPTVLVYDATDLDDWTPLGPLLDARAPLARELAPAEIWECPQLVQIGEDWILIVSRFHSHGGTREEHGVSALVGSLEPSGSGLRFRVRSGGALDDGPDFYAPQVYDAGDRVLLWGWSWEGRGPADARRSRADVAASGWAGTLTHPRELYVAADGTVGTTPARELTGLRSAPLVAAPSGAVRETAVAEAAWEAVTRGTVLVLLRTPDGDHVAWRGDGPLEHRILFDGSILEAFDSAGRATTVRLYPRTEDRWVLQTVGPLHVWQLGHGLGETGPQIDVDAVSRDG